MVERYERYLVRRRHYDAELAACRDKHREVTQQAREIARLRQEQFGVFNTLWGKYSRLAADDPTRVQLERRMLEAEDSWLRAESQLRSMQARVEEAAQKCHLAEGQVAYYQRILDRTNPSRLPIDDLAKQRAAEEKLQKIIREELRKLEAEERRAKELDSLMRGTFPAASRSNDSRHKPYRWVKRDE